MDEFAQDFLTKLTKNMYVSALYGVLSVSSWQRKLTLIILVLTGLRVGNNAYGGPRSSSELQGCVLLQQSPVPAVPNHYIRRPHGHVREQQSRATPQAASTTRTPNPL